MNGDDLIGAALSALLSSGNAHSARKSSFHPVLGICLVALGATLAALAVGCGLAALWLYLLALVGPVKAPLIVASILVLAAIVLAAIGGRMFNRPVRTAVPPLAAAVARLPVGEIAKILRRHRLGTLLTIVALGLAVGSGIGSTPPAAAAPEDAAEPRPGL